uniref:Innexin n=1 Tax=Heterorhabditis bacteriophora TaxID=37862 RepID=A0A1I7XMU4_HETBA
MFFLDAFLKGLKPQYDDDACDRLNYYFTPMLLVIFSLTLSAKQYVGQPIQCWIPAQFTGAWEQYSENYCFVQNTYFVRPDGYIPDSTAERENSEIGYYQWVPFILGLQAILFYLPALFWRLFNWQSGSRTLATVLLIVFRALFITINTYLMSFLLRKDMISIIVIFTARTTSFVHRGMYLTSLYLLVKIMYLIQVVVQFVILNKVTMCDFEVRNLIYWCAQLLSEAKRKQFIGSYLKVFGLVNEDEIAGASAESPRAPPLDDVDGFQERIDKQPMH